MNFDEYMNKLQYISNILENSKNADEILENPNINLEQDFQYICLSSATNYDLVNEIIAKIAEEDKNEIIENNLKMISISMWNDIFNKNEKIKKLFIENYNKIFENASILTMREIENFINDKETLELMYGNLGNIIKKLCTYDRASLISELKTKEKGIENIKNNLDCFFEKGDFDITTTYSKVLHEFDKISEIPKIDVLKSCINNLDEMIERETAVDNETDKLLTWIYDTVEEKYVFDSDEKRELTNKIDNAITKNFENILDKSDYDKNTIKVLKQFECTKPLFEKNKSNFEKKHEPKYDFNHITQNMKKNNVVQFHNNQINTDKKSFENFKNENNVNLSNIQQNKVNFQNTNQNELDEKIQNLVVSNLNETNKIIDKVLNKNNSNISNKKMTDQELIDSISEIINKDNQLVENISKLLENEKKNSNVNVSFANSNNTNIGTDLNYNVNNTELSYKLNKQKNGNININNNQKINKQRNEIKKNNENNQQVAENMQLIEQIDKHRENLIKRIWNKIIHLFKAKNEEEEF